MASATQTLIAIGTRSLITKRGVIEAKRRIENEGWVKKRRNTWKGTNVTDTEEQGKVNKLSIIWWKEWIAEVVTDNARVIRIVVENYKIKRRIY